MKLRKIGIANKLRKSGVMVGLKLIKKLSDGVYAPWEIANALGIDKKRPSKKSKPTVTHKGVVTPITRKGRKPKTVVQYSKTGEYMGTYACCADAAKKYSISTQAIRKCAKGDQKTAAGFQWKYR